MVSLICPQGCFTQTFRFLLQTSKFAATAASSLCLLPTNPLKRFKKGSTPGRGLKEVIPEGLYRPAPAGFRGPAAVNVQCPVMVTDGKHSAVMILCAV